MPRVTNAVASRKRRKRRLDAAKGFYGSRSKLFRQATEAVDRAMALSYAHRKEKKRDFRGLWIVRLSAGCRANDISYSRLVQISEILGVSVIDLITWPEKYISESSLQHCCDCVAKDATITNLNKYIELLEKKS